MTARFDMKIAAMRHGIPEGVEAGRYLGQSDPPLAPEGRAAVAAAAERLRERGVERIVASPLRRARETAELVGETLGVPVMLDGRLREIDFGACEGKTFAEVAEAFPEVVERWTRYPDDFVFPGGESAAAFGERVAAAAEMVRRMTVAAASRGEGSILTVSHGGTIRVLLGTWLGMPTRYTLALRVGYAGWATVRFSGGPLGELVELAQTE